MMSWLRRKALDLMMYFVYVRLLLEIQQTLLLSSTNEILDSDYEEVGAIVSIIIAWFVLLFCLIMPVIAICYFWKFRRGLDSKHKFFFKEFFADLKNSVPARLYTF